MKNGGLGIPDPQLLTECAYNTFKSASEFLVGSLLRGTELNYVAYKACIRISSPDRRKQREFSETEAVT